MQSLKPLNFQDALKIEPMSVNIVSSVVFKNGHSRKRVEKEVTELPHCGDGKELNVIDIFPYFKI